MPKNINTFTQFLPSSSSGVKKVIVKNESYFSLIFLGGNYLSKGSILQKIFGGRDEVALIAGLRLQPDGLLINTVEEPNVVLDKRSIKPGKITNIPMILNLLVKIPAYMDSIGFSFKIATIKRSDNFSAALDVLNDAANKSVIESFMPGVVGKALGVGKVVKDIFDKIDAANNRDLIQLVVSDFIVPAKTETTGSNILQEGYVVIFVKNEAESSEEAVTEQIILDDGFNNEKELSEKDTVYLDVKAMEESAIGNEQIAAIDNTALVYDEANKVLKSNGKLVVNTYLIFKIQKESERGENLNSTWSKKFVVALDLLSNELNKTKAKLEELKPRVSQYLNEANALLTEDSSFTPTEKKIIKEKYRVYIAQEQKKFTL